MARIIVDDTFEVKVNGSLVGKQRGINFIPGRNIAISGSDDQVNEDVDITIAEVETVDEHIHNNLTTLDKVDQNLGTVDSPAFAGLTVKGDIATDGKVDGVDISAHAADVVVHHPHSNKSQLDKINQGLGTVDSPSFSGMAVKGNITVDGTVDGIDISAHAADVVVHHPHSNKSQLDKINQGLGTVDSPSFSGMAVKGNITVDGTVDGIDISAHAADVVVHHPHSNKSQLDKINQGLGTVDSPSFSGMAVKGNITVDGTVDGIDVSSHATRHLAGGIDALTGVLDANARVQVKANGAEAGSRRAIHFIAGNNLTITAIDDPGDEAVNITIAGSPEVNGREEVIEKSLPSEILPADLNKTILCTNLNEMCLTLPAWSADLVGFKLTLIKATNAKVQVKVAATDRINNSTLGGYLYNDETLEEWQAAITILCVTTNRWASINKFGTWYTV